MRARRREHAGTCPKCGAASPAAQIGKHAFCDACAVATLSSYRLGFWFFLGMAFLAGALMIFGIASDLRRGFSVEPKDLVLMLGAGVGGPLALALWIRSKMRS